MPSALAKSSRPRNPDRGRQERSAKGHDSHDVADPMVSSGDIDPDATRHTNADPSPGIHTEFVINAFALPMRHRPSVQCEPIKAQTANYVGVPPAVSRTGRDVARDEHSTQCRLVSAR